MLAKTAFLAFALAGAQQAGIAQESPPVEARTVQQGDEARDDTAPDDTDAITVTGQLEQRKAILGYIDAVISETPGDQYARFTDPVCPSAIGFSKENNALIEKRIRQVAKHAGVEVADAECSPNIHLLIVDDGKSALRTLRRRYRAAFGQMPLWQRDRLQRNEGPVYAWHTTDTISNEDGTSRSRLGAGVPVPGGGNSVIGSEAVNAARTSTKSLIGVPVRQELRHAFVIIEQDAVAGMTTVQLADYALMRGLIQTDPEGPKKANIESVLELFDPELRSDDRPLSVRDWDVALLTALYKAPVNVRSARQRSAMRQFFTDYLNTDDGGK
ncbi:MAG: hypothetical protein AAFX04_04300 [Pseudomonadota bacterium]